MLQHKATQYWVLTVPTTGCQRSAALYCSAGRNQAPVLLFLATRALFNPPLMIWPSHIPARWTVLPPTCPPPRPWSWTSLNRCRAEAGAHLGEGTQRGTHYWRAIMRLTAEYSQFFPNWFKPLSFELTFCLTTWGHQMTSPVPRGQRL